MKTMHFLRLMFLTAMLGVILFIASLPHAPKAEASPAVSGAFLNAAGQAIPGLIPPRVTLDLANAIPLANNWIYLATFKGTEFATRAAAASGLIDAGFTATDGLVFTLDIPSGIRGGNLVETEDVLIKSTVFTFGAPDAGSSTLLLDVGRTLDAGVGAPTLERYIANDSLLAASTIHSAAPRTTASSVNLDAGWIIPSTNIDQFPHTFRFTFTQSAKSLVTVTGGQIDIYVKAGSILLK